MMHLKNQTKWLTFFFLIFCALLLNSESLKAQNKHPFSLELSTSLGYSDFLFSPNEFDVLWSQPGVNTERQINRRIQGAFGWQVGLGVIKPLSNQFQIRTKVSLVQASFSHRLEGLAFPDDLFTPNEKETSSIQSDFRIHHLEIPLEIDYYWSAKASSFFNTLGIGVSNLLRSNETSSIQYADGTFKESSNALDYYEATQWKGFLLVGMGKRIPLNNSKSQLSIGLQYKYYLAKENIKIFDLAGRLSTINLQLTYRPW